MIKSGTDDKCECGHPRFEHVGNNSICARCIEDDGGCQQFQRQLTYSVFVAEILDEGADHIWLSRRMAAKVMNLVSPFTSLHFNGNESFMGATLAIDDSLGDNEMVFGVDKQRHVEFV